MLFCMFGLKEYYPFAPYTMYSYNHSLKRMAFLRFYCLNQGKKILLTNPMITPLDTARLEMSISDEYYLGARNASVIIDRLTSLKTIVLDNSYPCEKVVLDFVRYQSPQDYLSENGKVIDRYEGETAK